MPVKAIHVVYLQRIGDTTGHAIVLDSLRIVGRKYWYGKVSISPNHFSPKYATLKYYYPQDIGCLLGLQTRTIFYFVNDVIKMETFTTTKLSKLRITGVREIYRSPVDFLHKVPVMRRVHFSLWAWTSHWTNSWNATTLICHPGMCRALCYISLHCMTSLLCQSVQKYRYISHN